MKIDSIKLNFFGHFCTRPMKQIYLIKFKLIFLFLSYIITVQMHCIYSIGHNNTEYKYTYSTDSEQSQPQIEYGDGDHTVNAESLRVCQQWKQAGQPVSAFI
jgi:hypothetical protein